MKSLMPNEVDKIGKGKKFSNKMWVNSGMGMF